MSNKKYIQVFRKKDSTNSNRMSFEIHIDGKFVQACTKEDTLAYCKHEIEKLIYGKDHTVFHFKLDAE